jgi:EAL domain-containing protein (putative c-di-GMP-specific phosphodiesterase class I)
MKKADLALYRKKSVAATDIASSTQMTAEADASPVGTGLAQAIVNNGWRSTISRSSTSARKRAVEALVRWRHRGAATFPRSSFARREGGLIIPLGEWVLQRRARRGSWPSDIKIAVNLSPHSGAQPGGHPVRLSKSGLALEPSSEITESVLIKAVDVLSVIRQLKNIRCRSRSMISGPDIRR